MGGCDLFRLRDSDPPTKPAAWNNYATSWDLCLQNLEYCYADSRNAVKYSGLFSSDFAFHFSAQDVNDYGIIPIWNISQEQDMLLVLHSQSDSLLAELQSIPDQTDDITASEAKIYRSYILQRYYNDQSQPVTYSGNLEIHFRKIGGYWYISKWYDYRTGTHTTWGKMKYDYAQ